MALTAEQLDLRRQGISATDMVKLVEGKALQVWLEKRGLADPMIPNARIRAGQKFQQAIAEWAAEELGVEIGPECTTERHPTIPWALATPDYPVLEDGRRVALIECKNVGLDQANAWKDSAGEWVVPDKHQVQASWQMLVTGLPRVWVAGCIGGNDLHVLPVERDEDLIAGLVDIGRAFWERHVVGGVEPEPDGSEDAKRYLQRRFAKTSEAIVDATPEIEALADELRSCKARLRADEVKAKVLEQKICAAIGDSLGIRGRFGVIKWVSVKETHVAAFTKKAYRRVMVPWSWANEEG